MTAILSHRSQEGRIDRLDATRGIAILGILLMNIFGFALPQMAYINPVYSQSISQIDMAIWVFFNLFIQGKFLTIFSILFGATLALLRRKGDRWNMSRLVILAVLGLIHGIGFWSGDILFAYAVTGCIALLIFKQYDPGNLLKIAGFVYFIGLVSLLLLGSTVGSSDFWVVSEEQALYESLGNTAGGSVSLIYRTQSMLTMVEMLFIQYGWQLLGLMIAGYVAMRSGWLSGQFSSQHYRRMAMLLIIPALLVQAVSLYMQSLSGWSYFATAIVGYVINELMSPLQSFGYIALIYGFWGTLQHSVLAKMLQCTGRMALSNYLLQTLICVTIFYYSGYFNHFSRSELLLFIVPIWAVNLLFSYFWLSFFHQGPMEWGWRRLTEKLDRI
ncbi:DUF418 domain-containing protein [Providencia stuartii]|uniref:DUF418 domain-containing protein n=1 Tax=Providencia stuartii ATCC 25827 TaxID=471874 RepID=A0AA86YH93_PROST|nr:MULTISPECIES: DUF418 domain-containing protein YeiB [Providencia]EDU58465.1 hypothetical protein PROSTU_01640 [Providencia stuartii ATCC 25827]MBS7785137.1 DUF418 domain-containing protein [Providencia thailandensis]MTC83774.1 DUF418 domain-containing protein [Providencia stuartii]MTC94608.1 DUF418 domain-containing protein [Providencia stuartii]